MTTTWFFCGYKLVPDRPQFRYCAMDDFTSQIEADGGAWAESEVLGASAVVKVRASDATLGDISSTTGFDRIPWDWLLQDTMENLSNAQYNVLRGRVRQMGYTDAEMDTTLGSNLAAWRQLTFQQLLNFICQRRLKPRWDEILQQIVLDGEFVACKPPAEVDAEVENG